jgi:hypothetical protein
LAQIACKKARPRIRVEMDNTYVGGTLEILDLDGRRDASVAVERNTHRVKIACKVAVP